MSKPPRTWDILSARTVYDNPWITVRDYKARAPTGAEAQYGLVHMKKLAVGVLPIDENGCTILVGQQRFCFGRYSWELPEGGGDENAPPLETARRELSEETGLAAAHWQELFGDVHLSNSVTDERAFAYLAWGLAPDASHTPDAWEALEIRRIPFAEAVNMAATGRITDAFSLVMLLKADHLARTGALPPDLVRLIGQGS